MGEERIQDILKTIQKIKDSEKSVSIYFRTKRNVPFSKAQYYNYLNCLKRYGEEGLKDKRKDGNNRKLTQSIKDYISICIKEKPSISASQLRMKIQKQFDTDISKSSVNDFRKSKELSKQTLKEKKYEFKKSGGGEILTSLAFFSGILEVLTKTIVERVDEVRKSPSFNSQTMKKDHPAFRVQGKFTKEYNQIKSVRKNRFKSIDEKIPKKNYSSMNIFRTSEKTISRYNLALLCLPLVTYNGKSSRVNRVKGNDLSFLCGYNYKDAALDKYLRELKYLKVSEKLIIETAKFWMDFWRDREPEETVFACYYIDGNTKALWSQDRCYKGKVTMLGRVMNCLENVFIHDGKGHPLYFQTFHGHADLGEHALSMITKLTKHFSDVSSQISIKRVLVIDGGGNSVKTMRAFSSATDDEYFITILDNNQVKERKFKHIRRKRRYRFGAAGLIDCRIELLDSTEKGYIYESRAVIVRWDNGRESVLVTNIPADLLDGSEITKRYFDRWPKQEKQFRDAKGPLNIHRIVGYGKKLEDYDNMKERYSKIKKTIKKLRTKLKNPLREIEKIEKELASLYRRERKLREKSKIELGKRVLDVSDSEELKQIKREIDKCLRSQKAIEKPHKEDFAKLKENLKEEGRIRFKDKVYRIDTELDQIMTCFKLSFANLCSFLLTQCMNHERYELVTLFESIFQLDGNVKITDSEKIIKLKRNPKEPMMMKKLETCIQKLNGMNIKNLEGRLLQFII